MGKVLTMVSFGEIPKCPYCGAMEFEVRGSKFYCAHCGKELGLVFESP